MVKIKIVVVTEDGRTTIIHAVKNDCTPKKYKTYEEVLAESRERVAAFRKMCR